MHGAEDFVPLSLGPNTLHHCLPLEGHQRLQCLGVYCPNDYQGKPRNPVSGQAKPRFR